jgi:hypothetical protein
MVLCSGLYWFLLLHGASIDVTVCFSMVGGSPPVVLNSPFVEVFFVIFFYQFEQELVN